MATDPVEAESRAHDGSRSAEAEAEYFFRQGYLAPTAERRTNNLLRAVYHQQFVMVDLLEAWRDRLRTVRDQLQAKRGNLPEE